LKSAISVPQKHATVFFFPDDLQPEAQWAPAYPLFAPNRYGMQIGIRPNGLLNDRENPALSAALCRLRAWWKSVLVDQHAFPCHSPPTVFRLCSNESSPVCRCPTFRGTENSKGVEGSGWTRSKDRRRGLQYIRLEHPGDRL